MKAKEWSARLIEHLPVFIAGDGTANEAFAKDIAELNLECAESINARIRAFDENNERANDFFEHYIRGLKEASEKWNAVCHRVNLAYQIQRDQDGEIYLLARGAMAMHLLAFLRDAYAEEGGMLDTLSLSDASTFIAHTVQVMHNLPLSAKVTALMVAMRDLESTMSEDECLEKNERDLELLLDQMRRR